MLAGILVVTVLVELVVSVFCLMRWREVKRECRRMANHCDDLSEAIRSLAVGGGVPVELPVIEESSDAVANAQDILSAASPEDLDKAAQLLRKLGVNTD